MKRFVLAGSMEFENQLILKATLFVLHPENQPAFGGQLNIKKVEELTKQGLMHQAGLISFSKRKESKSKIYTYKKVPVDLDKAYEMKFKENEKAWAFFQAQAPSYKKTLIHRIMNAKQEVTRISRLEKLINTSEA